MESLPEQPETEVIIVFNPELEVTNDSVEKVLGEFFGRHFFIINPITNDIDIVAKSDFYEAGGRVEIGLEIDEDTRDRIEDAFILPDWN